ncbi:MAG TPA: DUF721 domain-containing protein [Devosia sp.]|nr:DUF721 domain-containing protein [Devosia sp.]
MPVPPHSGKRKTRSVRALGDLVSGLLDPMLKKRGFASRDIIDNWQVIAPPPYNRVTSPHELKWPRGTEREAGAILFVRCAEAHRLALSHDQQRLSDAINRYFGYVLVRCVKLSAAPFVPPPFMAGSDAADHDTPIPDPGLQQQVEQAIHDVADQDVRDALKKLGMGVLGRSRRPR